VGRAGTGADIQKAINEFQNKNEEVGKKYPSVDTKALIAESNNWAASQLSLLGGRAGPGAKPVYDTLIKSYFSDSPTAVKLRAAAQATPQKATAPTEQPVRTGNTKTETLTDFYNRSDKELNKLDELYSGVASLQNDMDKAKLSGLVDGLKGEAQRIKKDLASMPNMGNMPKLHEKLNRLETLINGIKVQ
jgi:hypothetical protein